MAKSKCVFKLPPKTRVFGGKRYQIVGTGTGQVSKNKRSSEEWAAFNRKVNNLNVRVVKVDGGYAIYTRKGKRK